MRGEALSKRWMRDFPELIGGRRHQAQAKEEFSQWYSVKDTVSNKESGPFGILESL